MGTRAINSRQKSVMFKTENLDWFVIKYQNILKEKYNQFVLSDSNWQLEY